MQVQPFKFTTSGIVGMAAHTAGTTFADHVAAPQQAQQVVGLAYTGFTGVVVHNGSDASGDVVAVCGGPGTYAWNYEVNCNRGLFLAVTGTGTGTVWLV